jgi:hypothetical protein
VGTQHWIYNVTGSPATSLYKVWTYEDVEYGTQQGEMSISIHTLWAVCSCANVVTSHIFCG